MDPGETAKNYNQTASWWQKEMAGSNYGISFLEKALTFVPKPGLALDVGLNPAPA